MLLNLLALGLITVISVSAVVLLYRLFSFIISIPKLLADIPYEGFFENLIGLIIRSRVSVELVPNAKGELIAIPKGIKIVVANHQGIMDGPIMTFATGEQLGFLATNKYNNDIPGIQAFLEMFKTIEVDDAGTDNSDPGSRELKKQKIITNALKRLREGVSLGIFPYSIYHTYKDLHKREVQDSYEKYDAFRVKPGTADIALLAWSEGLDVPIVVENIHDTPEAILGELMQGAKYYLLHGHHHQVSVETVIYRDEFLKGRDISTPEARRSLSPELTDYIAQYISIAHHAHPDERHLPVSQHTKEKSLVVKTWSETSPIKKSPEQFSPSSPTNGSTINTVTTMAPEVAPQAQPLSGPPDHRSGARPNI